MAQLPLTLMGAGPHPTWPRRHWWEKKSTVKLKDENGETHEFQNFVARVGAAPKPAEANTEATVRLTLTRSCLPLLPGKVCQLTSCYCWKIPAHQVD